jgi:hypothetical protein
MIFWKVLEISIKEKSMFKNVLEGFRKFYRKEEKC